MPPKKKQKAEGANNLPSAKLEVEEALTLDNLNLNVQKEEIFGRMDALNTENKRLKHRYTLLEEELKQTEGLYENERARGKQDRTDATENSEKLQLEC